jgi:rhamnulokinase
MPSSAVSQSRPRTYCAIDLGAQSGRVVLGRLHRGVLTMREIRRFPNDPLLDGHSLCWDVARLWREICCALREIDEPALDGLGVDAWGVDYALLGERGKLLENPYHYRDPRTRGVMEDVLRKIPKKEIYRITGIQFMPINTIYQLFAAKRDTPKLIESAERLLTIPDLFHYWLAGTAVCEFTNATTTQLVDASTRSWSVDLIERLGLPARLPCAIAQPGTILGPLLPELTGGRLAAPVILPGSHDTASAVAAVSAGGHTAFLSSGTWSLVGIELDRPVITPDALRLNFTNEGGVNRTTRLLKNVMGLWLLESCRKSWSAEGRDYSYEELRDLAASQPRFEFLLNPDAECFLSPPDMARAIHQFCDRTSQPRPSSPAACVRGILESLAFKYRLVIESLEQLIGRCIEQIRVIGGGSRNELLNQFTAEATGKRVLAGPAEATSLGNMAVQMVAAGAAGSLQEVRRLIDRSFDTKIYEPFDPGRWDEQVDRFRQYSEFACCSEQEGKQ